MDTRPLQAEVEYEAALAEIESLWGAPFGSPEGDRLDALVTLVEAYEEKPYPIPPPDPDATPLDQDDTFYLLSIPGMRESIITGMNTPTEDCDDEIEW